MLEEIQQEVLRIPEDLWYHVRKWKEPEDLQGWTKLALRGPTPRCNDFTLSQPIKFQDTDLVDQMPALAEYCRQIPGRTGVVYLSRLAPHSVVPRHVDWFGAGERPKRDHILFHLPILVNPGCVMVEWDDNDENPRLRVPEAGKLFVQEFLNFHMSANCGETYRTHAYISKALSSEAIAYAEELR